MADQGDNTQVAMAAQEDNNQTVKDIELKEDKGCRYYKVGNCPYCTPLLLIMPLSISVRIETFVPGVKLFPFYLKSQ